MEENIRILCTITKDLKEKDAEVLLKETRGDLNAAFNLFLDRNQEKSNPSKIQNEYRKKRKFDSLSLRSQHQVDISSFFAIKNKKDDSPETKLLSSNEEHIKLDENLENKHLIKSNQSSATENVPYAWISEIFDKMEKTAARLGLIDIMASLFLRVLEYQPHQLIYVVYLCANEIAPPYEGIELNIGGSILSQAIHEISGWSHERLKKKYEEMGDLGDVADAALSTNRVLMQPKYLTAEGVYTSLKEIARLKGKGTIRRKIDIVKRLLSACRNREAKYIIRTLLRNMRIGAFTRTILTSLAKAFMLWTHPEWNKSNHNEQEIQAIKSLDQIIKDCYCQYPNYDRLVKELIKHRADEQQLLNTCQLTPGVPLKPMLGKITKDINEVMERLNEREFACDFKYDGQRAQLHYWGNKCVKIFSRHLEDMTQKFPDLVALVQQVCMKSNIESCILDAELVGIKTNLLNNSNNEPNMFEIDNKTLQDDELFRILPFQALTTRQRKNVNEESLANQTKIGVYCFDLLYLNGKSYLKESFRTRRDTMYTNFMVNSRFFQFARQLETSDAEKIRTFLMEAINMRCEGLMIKPLDIGLNDDSKGYLATYEPARRSDNWLKLKRDYIEGLADHLDLVPIGAWYGNGRKAGWYSPFLMAIYDSETEQYQTLCKCMSGFTDEFYKEQQLFYSHNQGRIIPSAKPYYIYDPSLEPDVWFEPCQVWEIRGADLTKSPIHKAAIGIVDPNKGLSLRFPRFIRKREDKLPEDATDPHQLIDLYERQQSHQPINFAPAIIHEEKQEISQLVKDKEDDDDELFI